MKEEELKVWLENLLHDNLNLISTIKVQEAINIIMKKLTDIIDWNA